MITPTLFSDCGTVQDARFAVGEHRKCVWIPMRCTYEGLWVPRHGGFQGQGFDRFEMGRWRYCPYCGLGLEVLDV